MNNLLLCIFLILINLFILIYPSHSKPKSSSKKKEIIAMLDKIKWLKHASFKINSANAIIYIDPFELPSNQEKADFILITHDHYDHCSINDIKSITKSSTTIIAPKDCAAKLNDNIKVIEINASIELTKNIKVKAIPAYNINKPFHPKAKGWLGYILTIDTNTLYFAGDTDFIDEMKSLQTMNIDIAFLPVSGTYVMTAQEAANAALTIKPKIAIPMHYGSIVGNESDANQFKKLLHNKIEVMSLNNTL